MRGHRLAILAAVSFAALAVLLCGYFATMGVAIERDRDSGSILYRGGLKVLLDRGECHLRWGEYIISTGVIGKFEDPFEIRPIFSAGLPDLRKTLWDVEVGKLSPLSSRGFYVTFPISLLALPCMISPILWWRRRHATGRGFGVLTARGTQT